MKEFNLREELKTLKDKRRGQAQHSEIARFSQVPKQSVHLSATDLDPGTSV